jgi:hypothetical protein
MVSCLLAVKLKIFFVNLLETNARFLQKSKDAFMKANALIVLFFFSGLPFLQIPLVGQVGHSYWPSAERAIAVHLGNAKLKPGKWSHIPFWTCNLGNP